MRDGFAFTEMMGYAYTPVTEAVLNWGSVGPAIFFGILSILLVKLVKNADLRPGLYFICFSVVVDFNRGDVCGTFCQLVRMRDAFLLMRLVSRIRQAAKICLHTFSILGPLHNVSKLVVL